MSSGRMNGLMVQPFVEMLREVPSLRKRVPVRQEKK